MTSHSRTRSKGSFSVFSIDTLRSFNRAGSRAASRARNIDEYEDLARSPSSLSRCDPLAQLPPSPAGGALDESPAVPRCGSSINTTNNKLRQNKFNPAPTCKQSLSSNTQKRARPFSWIILRAPAQALKKRSMSVQLPKDTSSSTMARSAISAPILTSTTNAEVAAAEGVHCGELTQETFDKSTWRPRMGLVKDDQSTAYEARILAEKISEEEANAEKPRGRFHKLSDALRSKLRRTDCPKAEDSSSLHNKIARRRAETLNLCKEKIKDLTGNGHVRRKSIDPNQVHRAESENPPLLKKTSQVFTLGEDNGSQYGSLSRSFNSALEKLDIAATTNMSFLRSRSSLFNMRKEIATPPVAVTPEPQMSMAGDSGNKDSLSTWESQKARARSGQKRDIKQYHYSPNKGGYIPAPPCAAYPSGVNGLRMHSDTLAFAERLNQPTADTSKPQADRFQETEDDALEEAPIYSPSMGDLSQYSNANTTAAKTVAPRSITPTRPSKVRTLKKSKSGLGLLGRANIGRRDENQPLKKSRSMMLNPFRKETPPPTINIKDSPYKPATPSPLRNEAKLVKGRFARPGLSPRSLPEQAKRFGVIGMPSPGKPKPEW